MRRGLVLVISLGSRSARADEPITIETTSGETTSGEATTENTTGRANEAPPMLAFDPTVRVAIERLDQQKTTVSFGPAEVHVGAAWRGFDPLLVGEHISPTWRAGIGGSIDLGFARLEGHYRYDHVETELWRGDAIDMGIALTKTFQMFGKDAFIKLTLDRREWRELEPPPGEFDATTLMLWFGLRW